MQAPLPHGCARVTSSNNARETERKSVYKVQPTATSAHTASKMASLLKCRRTRRLLIAIAFRPQRHQTTSTSERVSDHLQGPPSSDSTSKGRHSSYWSTTQNNFPNHPQSEATRLTCQNHGSSARSLRVFLIHKRSPRN
eukprot:6209306-Pleurochrysis_carterae.AAC.1